MNKLINEIIKKWEKTGLLKELSAAKKINCAISLEKMENILVEKGKQLNEGTNTSQFFVETIAATLLPIIRRLYNEDIKLMPSMAELYKDYLNFLSGPICKAYIKDLTSRLKSDEVSISENF